MNNFDFNSQSHGNGDTDLDKVKDSAEGISPESVDAYMRDAARMLYDILSDYLREQRPGTARPKRPASETKVRTERRAG